MEKLPQDNKFSDSFVSFCVTSKLDNLDGNKLSINLIETSVVIRWKVDDRTTCQTVIRSIRKKEKFHRKTETHFEIQTKVEPTGYPEKGSLYDYGNYNGWVNETAMQHICDNAVGVRLPHWEWMR